MVTESIAPDSLPKISRRARLQTDKVTGKPVLLYPEGVLVLNETGLATVTLCTGECTVEEIAGKLAGRYKAPLQTILPEVTTYLTRLRARNLLEFSAKKESKP